MLNKVQIILLKETLEQMIQENVKLRGRLFSEALTSVDEHQESQLTSITIKPKEDPDFPPSLQLEMDLEHMFELESGLSKGMAGLEVSSSQHRLRKRSEGNAHSILGFLSRKARNRLMSEQIRESASKD